MIAALYISADERAEECCARENKAKQNKNRKTWEKKVLYSCMMLLKSKARTSPRLFPFMPGGGNGWEGR